MPGMIDYAVLCRAIDDWKAGNAPSFSAPLGHATGSPSAETVVEGGYEAVEEAAEETVDEAAEEVAEEVAEEAAEPAQEQPTEDRTMIYHMPEIVDEGEEV